MGFKWRINWYLFGKMVSGYIIGVRYNQAVRTIWYISETSGK
jgi:hypothetical protein